MDITAQTIDKIISLKTEPTFKVKDIPELDGFEFLQSGKLLCPPRLDGSNNQSIQLNSLTGFVDFIKANQIEGSLVHILDPNNVSYLGPLDQKYKFRDLHCTAKFENQNFNFPFDTALDQERFILNLLANFEDNNYLQSIQSVVSNVEDVNGIELGDDGFKQNVTVKSGITYKKVEGIKNPITLTPKRTFREIEQVNEIYILRVQKGDKGLSFKLIKADGGDYCVTAQARIKTYLSEKLSGCKDLVIVG